MSFSREVKQELERQLPKSRHCQIAELAAIYLMAGDRGGNKPTLEPDTDNPGVRDKYVRLLGAAFGIETSPDELGRIPWPDALRVYGAFKRLGPEGRVILDEERCSGLLLKKTCCKRAFLRGAFLAAGSVNDPSKAYHLEIVCQKPALALQLSELMGDFALDARIVGRKGHQVVYLKEGAQIVDMLNVMEAYVSLMNLENVRIVKEMRNSVNRKVNCETANIHKTVSAAVRQIRDIRLIRERMGFDELPESLRQIAELRLEYPELPLKELGQLVDPPVGKSGANHRLRKLSAIAEKIRGE